jgi:putative transposase
MNKQKHGKRYSETEIVRILQEVSQGKALAEVARQYGVSENTIYRWKSRYGDMSSAEVQRVRALEAENARLKRMLAEQLMDNDALKELLRKKW